MTPKEVLAQIRQREVTTVDLRFMDFPGVWQHFSIPADSLTEETFEEGHRLRRLERRGLACDQRVGPAGRPPARDGPDRSVSRAADPDDDLQSSRTRSPTRITPATRATSPARPSATCGTPGWPISACSLPSSSFSCSTTCNSNSAGMRRFITSTRSKGRGTGAGSKTPTWATSQAQDWAISPVRRPTAWSTFAPRWPSGWPNAASPRRPIFMRSPPAGQCEIDLVPRPLVESADQVVTAKYIIRNVARRSRKTATFMPKPLFGDNGSGMHTHLTLWKDDQPLLAGQGYAGLSDLGIHAIGGLIKHAAALCAFANPTTNSYKRLVPGFEAPTKISYSRRNRAAIIRVPVNSPSPRSRRIEYRGPDSAANPYLLFSAMLMAVLDGIQNKLRPGDPLDKDIYDLQPEELETVPTTPRSLEASLEALEADHEFLLRGDVFTPDVIDTWIWYKQTHEVETIRVRPHPYEFALYYDV